MHLPKKIIRVQEKRKGDDAKEKDSQTTRETSLT